MRAVWFLFVSVNLACAADPALDQLERQIEMVSHTTDGVVGMSAIHLESKRGVSLHGTEGFPMASTFKVPVAIQILTLVDQGKLRLDTLISLTPSDLHPGSGILMPLLFHPGVSLSVENFLEIMLVVSDNTAADVMLREAGGPAAVTARMRALGFNGIRVDRPTALLIADWVGEKNLPPQDQWTPEMWHRLFAALPEGEHKHAADIATADPRDTATPNDMTKLLIGISDKTFLQAQSAQLLLDIMQRCETGKARLPGMLPEGTELAHKTGSLSGIVDDVGIITLPNHRGHVAISVFTKFGSKSEIAEKAIAEISRTVYDYFTLFPETQ